MEPEAEPEAEPVAEPEAEPTTEPEPETVSVDPQDVQILKLIKEQFDIKLAEKEAQIQRLTEVLGRPIRTIAGYDGGYWDECNEDVRQEFCDELEQAGIDDIDCVSLSTLRRYVPDIEGSVYYQLRAAYEYVTHGGGQASRAMKMDDEAAQPSPRTAREPQGMRDLPFDMDGFRNYMEQQTEALQMQFALYTAVTDLGEEDIARQWTQAVVFGQRGIDLDRLAAAIISVNNRYATHQEMIRAAVEVYHRLEEPAAAATAPSEAAILDRARLEAAQEMAAVSAGQQVANTGDETPAEVLRDWTVNPLNPLNPLRQNIAAAESADDENNEMPCEAHLTERGHCESCNGGGSYSFCDDVQGNLHVCEPCCDYLNNQTAAPAAAEPQPTAPEPQPTAAPQPTPVPQPPPFSDQMYEEAHKMLAEIKKLEAEHKAGRLTDIEYYEAITDLHEHDTCIVCGFPNGERGDPDVTLPCGHHIHSQCLIEWMTETDSHDPRLIDYRDVDSWRQRHRTCPMCSQPLLAQPTPAAPAAPAPARRRLRVLQPFVLHSEDDARQWLIDTAANNGTYSSLYVPFIHAVLETGRMQPQIAIWRRIFGAERWDHFVARYRQLGHLLNPQFTATGYVDANQQTQFLQQGGQPLEQEFVIYTAQITAQMQQPAAAAAPSMTAEEATQICRAYVNSRPPPAEPVLAAARIGFVEQERARAIAEAATGNFEFSDGHLGDAIAPGRIYNPLTGRTIVNTAAARRRIQQTAQQLITEENQALQILQRYGIDIRIWAQNGDTEVDHWQASNWREAADEIRLLEAADEEYNQGDGGMEYNYYFFCTEEDPDDVDHCAWAAEQDYYFGETLTALVQAAGEDDFRQMRQHRDQQS
eukprot:SAG11_NODE_1558_length_4679_cov_139.454148_1_plen_869_part_00